MENCKETKRKRRTKAEMEAARAAGLIPNKKTKGKTDNGTKDKEQSFKRCNLPMEQTVLIMSCLNPRVSKDAMKSAKDNGVEVVILEDKVIKDYLEARKGEGEEKKSMGDFLNDTTNRLHAEDQCVKLWTILTGGEEIEKASGRVFTASEVTKKTNLSHSKAQSIFQLLRAFGLLEFVKGSHEFVLNFEKKRCHQTIQTEVLSMVSILNNDIQRYKKSIESDESLSEEQRAEMMKTFSSAVLAAVEF